MNEQDSRAVARARAVYILDSNMDWTLTPDQVVKLQTMPFPAVFNVSAYLTDFGVLSHRWVRAETDLQAIELIKEQYRDWRWPGLTLTAKIDQQPELLFPWTRAYGEAMAIIEGNINRAGRLDPTCPGVTFGDSLYAARIDVLEVVERNIYGPKWASVPSWWFEFFATVANDPQANTGGPHLLHRTMTFFNRISRQALTQAIGILNRNLRAVELQRTIRIAADELDSLYFTEYYVEARAHRRAHSSLWYGIVLASNADHALQIAKGKARVREDAAWVVRKALDE